MSHREEDGLGRPLSGGEIRRNGGLRLGYHGPGREEGGREGEGESKRRKGTVE